ncbi:hypothetical protein, conserved [Plasmodium gonderi]|uniref:Gamma tubulin complex component protein N-terminal domain-containing protein n=1 Tax=Plasmodium gonderi TaxID=77519 RepID=A0A1Y1JQ28_PLAGO|nr:hypothetical protein, conserved [Plasmodium gonderi]GAW82553.1 hypothetical protein, conserved [Plasmodium gonderi]
MTSTYINEIRKKQKEYLSYLFGKFEKYSNEKVITNLINKSLNEISLHPFQDVNNNEVIDDINGFINELTINAEYKKKKIFKHLCEIFLNDKFYIYDEKDRYELKFVILKLLFLISESRTIDNTKHIDYLYDKYFLIKEENVPVVLNINEKNALDDINIFNIQEESKYLKELYDTDDEIITLSTISCEEDIQNDEDEKNKSQHYDLLSDTNNQLDNYKTQTKCDSDTKNNYSRFYEKEYTQYVDNYMKSKNDLTYENVIKNISQCVYEYPYNEDVGYEWKSFNESSSLQNRKSIQSLDSFSSYERYNKYRENENACQGRSKKNSSRNHIHRRMRNHSSSATSDEDILISLKKRQNKSKYEPYSRKYKEEHYFFNNINLFDEEHYGTDDKDRNIIYETDIYNLHNVFFSDTRHEDHAWESWEAGSGDNNYGMTNTLLEGEVRDRTSQRRDDTSEDNPLGHRSIILGDLALQGYRFNEQVKATSSNSQKCRNIIIVDKENNKGKFLDEKQTINERKMKRKNTFYVSEIFIIKEILMMLSLNCPIKFKEDYFTKFSDFLFNKAMDKKKIKEDFLFYIHIEKYEKNESVIKYRAVIKNMMNIKLYNIRRRIFKNYVKKIKKVSIKLFYLNIFFFLVDKFRYFFFLLPHNLNDIINHIIYIRENISNDEGKNNIFLLFQHINLNDNKSRRSNRNLYYPGNFLECFIDSLKCIYSEWTCIIDILYNYHTLLVMRQYNIAPVTDEKIWEFLNRMGTIRVIDYLRVDHFVNWKNKKRKKYQREEFTPEELEEEEKKKKKKKKNEMNSDPDKERKKSKHFSTSRKHRSIKHGRNRWHNAREIFDEQNLFSFRSLSLIHLHVIVNKYLYVWNNLYDFVNFMLSYLLYNISIRDYAYFNVNYDNAKKFSVFYDMTVLYWRNCQIMNNKSLEKIFRFLLNGLNVYYSKHISNWIKMGKIDDKFNEFFVYSKENIDDEPFRNQTLLIKKQSEFVICPEFFNSFVFSLISLGNNIRLFMKICNEKDIDYIDYYLRCAEQQSCLNRSMDKEIIRSFVCDKKLGNENYHTDLDYRYNNIHNGNNPDDGNVDEFDEYDDADSCDEVHFTPELPNISKRLHENTLNYYYNIENLKHIQNNSLDIIPKILETCRNKENRLPYFNKCIMSLNVSYDLYVKKFLQEQFFHCFLKSNRIFLHSLMKYAYLLEYFCCLRSLVFLEISDFISPFFELIFKETSIPIIDERNINTTFRQCIVHNSNQLHRSSINVKEGSCYSCSSFLHKRFVLLHMKILLAKDSHYKKEKKKNLHQGKKTGDFMHKQWDDSYWPNCMVCSREENGLSSVSDGQKKNSISFVSTSRNRNDQRDDHLLNGRMDNAIGGEARLSNYINDIRKGQQTKEQVTLVQRENTSRNQDSQYIREYSIYQELIKNFYKEEIITNILKRFHFTLRENKLYNNNINVISYRNLIIETRSGGTCFVDFLFDSKCLEKYSTIFSYFLEIKKSLHILNLVHIFYKYLKIKKVQHYEQAHVIIISLCILKYKIFFFLNTLYTYYQWILNFSWNHFIITLLKSKSLYQIKHSHQLYINFLIETMLIPIRTRHEELHNFYIINEYRKNNALFEEYERKFFNHAINKNKEHNLKTPPFQQKTWDNNISILHQTDDYNFGPTPRRDDLNVGISRVSYGGDNISPPDADIYLGQIKRNVDTSTNEDINVVKSNSTFQSSFNKQFLLNELFSNNLLNMLFIPSQIYEILLKLSKLFNINFDLNFDNSYDMTFFQSEKETLDEVHDYEEQQQRQDEDDEKEIMNVKNGIINSNNTIAAGEIEKNIKYGKRDSDENNPSDREHILFSINNHIKTLSKIFDIHYLEFMIKLNIISLNVNENSFFGPNKDSRLFNHVLRLDKTILKKITSLQYMLSFHSVGRNQTGTTHMQL